MGLTPSHPLVIQMTDATDSLVIEHLRAIRTAIDGLRDDNKEFRSRIGGLERSVADMHGQSAEHSVRMDKIITRLDRIERRLDLNETMPAK